MKRKKKLYPSCKNTNNINLEKTSQWYTIYYVCLYVLGRDYLLLCVFYLGLVDSWPKMVF